MSGRKRWTHLDQMVGDEVVGLSVKAEGKFKPRSPALPYQDRIRELKVSRLPPAHDL